MNLDAHQRLIAVPVLALALAVALLVALALSLPASAGAVSFFRGDFPVGTNPTSVAVGDFNGGAPDLAVANEGTDDVSVLLGNGFGQFTAAAPVSVGDAPSSIVAGSFNGDAFTDLAVASVGDDNITIRLGDGSGGFTGTGTVTTGTRQRPPRDRGGRLQRRRQDRPCLREQWVQHRLDPPRGRDGRLRRRCHPVHRDFLFAAAATTRWRLQSVRLDDIRSARRTRPSTRSSPVRPMIRCSIARSGTTPGSSPGRERPTPRPRA